MLAFTYFSEFTGYRRDSVFQWCTFVLGIALLLAAENCKSRRPGIIRFESGEADTESDPSIQSCGHPGKEEGGNPGTTTLPDYGALKRRKLRTFLELVLRDDPGAIGLKPDANGWVSVDELLKRAKRHGIRLDRECLDELLSEGINGFESGASGTLVRFKQKA